MKNLKQKYYCVFEATESVFQVLKDYQNTLTFEVPDTVFYKGGFPDSWYFAEGNKLKTTENFKDIDLNYISTRCIKLNSKYSIVTGYFLKEEYSNVVKKDKEITHSRLLINNLIV